MSEMVDFTWNITPPDAVNGEYVKAGDTQRIPRGRAESWAAVNYGYIGKPEPPDDKEVDFTWREDQSQAYNVMGIKAGQTTKVPAREALRMQLSGRGTIGKELKPHHHDQDALDKFMKEDAAKFHNPALDQKPDSG